MLVFKRDISSVLYLSRLIAKIVAVLTVSFSIYAQQAMSQSNTAEITIEAVSNSSATQGKNYVVTQYADESCSKRGNSDKVFRKKYAKDTHTFDQLAVEVGQPFIFQVTYFEKRRGEERRCASIANVDLKQNRNYKAVFSIVDEVLGCQIKIYDLSVTAKDAAENSGQMESTNKKASNFPMEMKYTKPEQTCEKVGKKGYRNGVAVYTYKERFN